MEKKLYTNDKNVPYTTTKISPIKSKSDIDAILSKWGITKIAWEFDIEHNKVSIYFELPREKFAEMDITPTVKLEPPRVWNKRKRGKPEAINWQVSMRILHWFIKTTLEMSYAMQSQKVVAFLPHIQSGEKTVKDIILPRLKLLKALPEELSDDEVEIIPPQTKSFGGKET